MFRYSIFCGIFPILELLLSYGVLYRKNESKIDTALKSWIVFWFAILLSTEILSLFDAISRENILIYHIVYLLLGIIGVFYNKKNLRYLKWHICSCPWLATGITVILLGSFICGMVYPPDNWDSLTYHLARVASWIQNGNVDFYFTPIVRQNYQMPLAEFGIMQLQLLTISDRFAFCAQWFSFLVSLMAVFRITEVLGGSAKSCWLASFIAAMVPMAFFQASSTQNDLVVASFLCIFARFLLSFTPGTVFWTALSFGLALMTKGTAYVYAAAIGSIIGSYQLITVSKEQRTKIFLCLLLTVITGLCCSIGFAHRFLAHRSMVGSAPSAYFIKSFTPSVLLRNLTKHVLIHSIPPSFRTSSIMDKIAYKLKTSHAFNNDNISNWGGMDFVLQYQPHEDFIGNFCHLGLYCLCIALITGLIIRKKRLKKDFLIYLISILFAFILFGMFLTWNPWLSRLHTAVFLLFAPVPAVLLETIGLRYKKIVVICCSLILFLAVVKIGFIDGGTRRFGYPLRKGTFPRQYEIQQTEKIVKSLKDFNINHLGIRCHGDDTAYLVFRALGMHAQKGKMTLDYDCSSSYIISFKHTPEEERKALPGYKEVAENELYRFLQKEDVFPTKTPCTSVK